jgi:hypothetical protein
MLRNMIDRVWAPLGKGSVNTFPRQRIQTQQQNLLEAVFSMRYVLYQILNMY